MVGELALHPVLCTCGSSIHSHAVFNRHPALFVLAQRRLNDPVLLKHLPMHDGQVVLLNLPVFPDPTQLARCLGVFGHERDAAGLAVQPVHQLRVRARPEVQPSTADKAGVLVRFGGMADQAGGLVDRQQFVVFVDDVEKFLHARMSRQNHTGLIPGSTARIQENSPLWLPTFTCSNPRHEHNIRADRAGGALD